jgi:hypothetical protein
VRHDQQQRPDAGQGHLRLYDISLMQFNRKRTFIAIFLIVVVVHIVALWGVHILPITTERHDQVILKTVFNTRTIDAPKPAATSIPPVAKTAPPARTSDTTATSQPDALTESETPLAEAQTATDVPDTEPGTTTTQDPASSTQPEPSPVEATSVRYRFAPPTVVQYNIKGEISGFAYFANGELRWQHNGSNYDAQLRISHFLLGSRTQSSSGILTPNGVEPHRFSDKLRTELVAELDHAAQRVTFAADGSQTTLEAGAQDQLSVFLQLGALLAGMPERYMRGDRLDFQAIGARSAEYWSFEIGALQTLELPGGTLSALGLKSILSDPNATQVEVWFAPSLDYLPVRIRLFQANGDFVEQQWRSNRRP